MRNTTSTPLQSTTGGLSTIKQSLCALLNSWNLHCKTPQIWLWSIIRDFSRQKWAGVETLTGRDKTTERGGVDLSSEFWEVTWGGFIYRCVSARSDVADRSSLLELFWFHLSVIIFSIRLTDCIKSTENCTFKKKYLSYFSSCLTETITHFSHCSHCFF